MSELPGAVCRFVQHGPWEHLVVAVSGGPDSQALLHLLAHARNLGAIKTLSAIGVDHGLRPDAHKELQLAKQLAEKLGVAFEEHRVEVGDGNLLSAARQARYHLLQARAHALGADAIATAHHQDDQAETLLMHLAHGCALRGARGMLPHADGIVRPLLEHASKQDILRYLEEHNIPYALDPSNARGTRGRLRHNVLPELSMTNGQAVANLVHFARCAREDEQFLDQLVSQQSALRLCPMSTLDVRDWRTIPRPLALRVVRHWLERHQLATRARILEQLHEAAFALANTSWSISNRTVRMERGFLWPPFDANVAPKPLVRKTPLGWLPGNLTMHTRGPNPGLADCSPEDPTRIALDADDVHLPLWVRPWRPGDVIHEKGKSTARSVKTMFNQAKIPLALRARWPLVIDNAGTMVWVVGLKRASIAPIQAQTRRILELQAHHADPWWYHASFSRLDGRPTREEPTLGEEVRT